MVGVVGGGLGPYCFGEWQSYDQGCSPLAALPACPALAPSSSPFPPEVEIDGREVNYKPSSRPTT